ncbi:hypothetical protein QEG73_05230 [Chitinophagaceae bacterium 26-R-25]|nr:hypothetical protein [Chitinophagaceae bacterium 26-R-25]
MSWQPFLDSVDNKTIQFVTHQSSGSQFAVIGRSVDVVAPDAVLHLVREADINLLPALINLLKDSSKAWAAEIILSSLTAVDGKIIESYQTNVKEWWENIGVNEYQHWNNWYLKNKNNIQWNKMKGTFEIRSA